MGMTCPATTDSKSRSQSNGVSLLIRVGFAPAARCTPISLQSLKDFVKQWEFGTGGTIDSSPAISPDGTVYFGSADGRLYALKGSSGLAPKAWPVFGHDLQHTGRASFQVQPPTLSALGFSNGLFTLRVTAASGETLVIQATTNLTNWQDVHTNTTANGSFDFSDPETAQFSNRFYRALRR